MPEFQAILFDFDRKLSHARSHGREFPSPFTQHIEMSNANWFTTDYDYSGYAEAVFDEPHAEFHGPAFVRPDENGRPVVEITVERSNPPVQTQFDLLAIQFGSQPVPGGGG